MRIFTVGEESVEIVWCVSVWPRSVFEVQPALPQQEEASPPGSVH